METIVKYAQGLVYSLICLMPSTYQSDAPEKPDPWVRVLNGKRGLHIVVLYLMIGEWRIPWSFRVWRGKGHPSTNKFDLCSHGFVVLAQTV